MTIAIPFHGCYVVAQTLTVTIRCPNCGDEIGFVAVFQAYTEIPRFSPLFRCTECRQYFVDDDGAGYSIEPYSGRTVLEWRAIAEAMVCRVPTKLAGNEKKLKTQ